LGCGVEKNIGMTKASVKPPGRRFLTQGFDHLRLSMSAQGWALDAADMGWRFLVSLDKTVKKN
jgi:hypothetical protein